MSKLFLLILLAAVVGCEPNNTPRKDVWKGQEVCTLMLVAYRTSKHSKYYMEEVSTGTLFYMTGLGGRRIPTIPLGATVKSRCGYNSDKQRVTEFYNYKESIVTYTSGTKVNTLAGYEYLFN